jgi:hypothetical protein
MANVYFPIYPEQSTPTQLPGASSAVQAYPLGTKLEARDGRIWRYCKAGGTQLAAGLMGQSPAIDAKLENEVQTGNATNIGDTVISVLITTGSGLTPANLAGGYMVVEDVTGEGQYYKINTAAWATSDTVLAVTLDEPLRVATDATSEVSLYPNPWLGIVVAPTTLTGYCVGVATGIITANHYYWAQRCGPCAMVVDDGETVVVGEAAGYPATIATPGAVGISAVTDPIWGEFMGVAAAGETALVYLRME